MSIKYKTMDQISKSVESIKNRSARLQDDIHLTAISMCKLWHDQKSAETRSAMAVVASEVLTNLGNASPYHRQSFFKWVATIPGMQWSSSEKAWFVNSNDEVRLMGKAFIELRDTPFFDLTPPPEAKPFDLVAQITALVDRAEKRQVKNNEQDTISSEVLNKLRAAVAA
jgi:hypothetical protein